MAGCSGLIHGSDLRTSFMVWEQQSNLSRNLLTAECLGWPLKVTVSGITGYDWKFYWSGLYNLKPMPVPPELDYDFWLGPAPYKPYNPERVHSKFRGYWDYDGGGLGDMGQHYLDPVQYMLGKDDTGPVSVEIDAPQQHYDAVGSWRRITYTYADGCQIILDGENRDKDAAYIEGPKGKVYKGFRSDIRILRSLLIHFLTLNHRLRFHRISPDKEEICS